VQSFAFGGNGLLYTLQSGALYQCNPSLWNWTSINSQVKSFTMGGDGKLYATKVDGSYWRYDQASGWVRASSGRVHAS
jgi:outer membrane protein assembly factor BamB